MPKQTTPKYPGKLGKKLSAPKTIDTFPSDKQTLDFRLAISFEVALLEWEYSTEIENRMALLFDHFEIPQPATGHEIDSWRKMAFKLAINHVPGFQRNQLGRAQKWGRLQIAKLYVDVQRKMLEGKSERQACRHLAVKEPWRSFVQSKVTNRGDEVDNRAKALHRRFKKTQQEQHIIVTVIKGLEERWPERLDEILQMSSEQLDF